MNYAFVYYVVEWYRLKQTFGNCILRIAKKSEKTVIDSLLKSLLLEAVRKIQDSFLRTAGGLRCLTVRLTFLCGSILRILTRARLIKVACHHENCSFLRWLLTSVPPGGGTLIWPNCWISYPFSNTAITRSFVAIF